MAFDISEEQVALAEAELGRRLPPVYRSLMMANNGGLACNDEDEWELHPIKDASERKRLSRSCNHLLAETKVAREWQGFPGEALAIGANGSGDVILLLPSGSDSTSYGDDIFVFLHETGAVQSLATNLSEFEIE